MKFLWFQDFGKTPTYLEKRKQEIAKAQEEYDRYVQEHFRQGAMQQLSEQERCEILAGLKTNWEQIHHEYQVNNALVQVYDFAALMMKLGPQSLQLFVLLIWQGLSVVTDTAPKKTRKERLEAEMRQLERDIETIEKYRTIYIAN